MSWTATEVRLRDALLAAILPAPGRDLPGIDELDLDAFWARFDTSAPAHLRVGLRTATLVLGACGTAVRNPVTGETERTVMDEQTEIAEGAKAHQQVLEHVAVRLADPREPRGVQPLQDELVDAQPDEQPEVSEVELARAAGRIGIDLRPFSGLWCGLWSGPFSGFFVGLSGRLHGGILIPQPRLCKLE